MIYKRETVYIQFITSQLHKTQTPKYGISQINSVGYT